MYYQSTMQKLWQKMATNFVNLCFFSEFFWNVLKHSKDELFELFWSLTLSSLWLPSPSQHSDEQNIVTQREVELGKTMKATVVISGYHCNNHDAKNPKIWKYENYDTLWIEGQPIPKSLTSQKTEYFWGNWAFFREWLLLFCMGGGGEISLNPKF